MDDLLTPIRCSKDTLELLEQRALPMVVKWVSCRTAAETAAAISDMVVRGAPAISIAAAYGLALEVQRGGDRQAAHQQLLAARPTAVNLRWALERLATVPDAKLMDAARELHLSLIHI